MSHHFHQTTSRTAALLLVVSTCLGACTLNQSNDRFEQALHQAVEQETYLRFGEPKIKIQDFSSGELNQRVR